MFSLAKFRNRHGLAAGPRFKDGGEPAISPDARVSLDRNGALFVHARFGVVYTISPSPLEATMVWVGTDDGLIHVTRDDGKTWDEPVAKGVFARDAKLKRVKFAAPVTAKFVKLVAESGYADGPWASLAEFNVIDAQ